jgi:hypothetical protein
MEFSYITKRSRVRIPIVHGSCSMIGRASGTCSHIGISIPQSPTFSPSIYHQPTINLPSTYRLKSQTFIGQSLIRPPSSSQLLLKGISPGLPSNASNPPFKDLLRSSIYHRSAIKLPSNYYQSLRSIGASQSFQSSAQRDGKAFSLQAT